MTWWLIFSIFFLLLLILIIVGVHVAFSFLILNIVFAAILMGYSNGISLMTLSLYDSVSNFSFSPIIFFVLMGELLATSGLLRKILDEFSKWIGKLPGRLALLSLGGGTLFAALSGSAMANISLLGSTLTPEMEARGYKTSLTISPVVASGTLAMIIPPSSLAIILGGLSKTSVSDLLIAGILPGILMGLIFVFYYLYICIKNPEIAPSYDIDSSQQSFKEKLSSTLIYLIPVLLLIIIVLGSIFLGVATPTESAGIGTAGAFLLILFTKRLNWDVIKDSLTGTIKISGMIFLIIASANGFSQLLSYTGATRNLVSIVLDLSVPPSIVIISMLVVVLILGFIIEANAIMLMTIPLFLPILEVVQVDMIWFGILFLICLGIGALTPPLGLHLFVMKGVVSDNISMSTIFKSAIPVVIIMLISVIIIFLIPEIATWLPNFDYNS